MTPEIQKPHGSLSARDIALTVGLGLTPWDITRRALREKWPHRWVGVSGERERSYIVICLPRDVQLAILAALDEAETSDPDAARGSAGRAS